MNKFRISPINHLKTAAVFLPGWGFDGRIIELAGHQAPWIYPINPVNPSTLALDLAQFLEKHNISRVHLSGWSMGGYVALEFADTYPDKTASITLLAVRRAWPDAEIDDIRSDFLENPEQFLKSFYRKCFMGYKEAYGRFTEELEKDYLADPDVAALSTGLDYLKSFTPPHPFPKTTVIHGKRDLVAPINEMISAPECTEKIIRHGGHPVFLDKDFSHPVHKNKKEVIRRKFSRAATTYDQYAQVQKELAKKLISMIPETFSPRSILEIGCGTGSYTARLAEKFPGVILTALDFSNAMVEQATAKLPGASNVTFFCRDGEDYLQEENSHFDFITSNATMQWFDDLNGATANISKRLNPEGMLLYSIFGPRTMEKVALALNDVLGRTSRLPSASFYNQEQLHKILSRYFAEITLEEIIITRNYQSLHELLRFIQKTGTSGWQSPPVFSRKRLELLDQWFTEKFNGYHITNQIFLITAKNPRHTTT